MVSGVWLLICAGCCAVGWLTGNLSLFVWTLLLCVAHVGPIVLLPRLIRNNSCLSLPWVLASIAFFGLTVADLIVIATQHLS